MKNNINIRELTSSDIKAISELITQLGYSVEIPTLKDQIEIISSNESHWAYVAIYDDKVVGYIHGFFAHRITSEPFAEISSLAVDKNY